MKSMHLAPLGVLIILVAVHARHHAERTNDEADSSDDFIEEATKDHIQSRREHASDQIRHRRKRWQMNYGYDYAPPSPPNFYIPDFNRRDYDNRQTDLYPQILRLLDEILSYIKRPPPPPQPIYIPYPVPYPVPQRVTCRPADADVPPRVNVSNRWPEMDDPRQNWGLEVSNTQDPNPDDKDYVDDSIRPISFTPLRPQRPPSRVQPTVEHGTVQAGSSLTSQSTRSPGQTRRVPNPTSTGSCDAAVLSCCKPDSTQMKSATCFSAFGCSNAFRNGEACDPKNIQAVLDLYANTYIHN